VGSRALISLGALAAALIAVVAALVPPGPPLAVAAIGALTVGLALHGLGRIAGWLVADHDAPAALAVAWGLAIYVALGGALAAAGQFGARGQTALTLAGVVVSASWIVRRDDQLAARLRAWRPSPDTLVALAVAAGVAVHYLGGAGSRDGGFVDGDGDLLGPLARLAQTGGLVAPRGSVIATSLGWVLGDGRASHAVDGGLGLALALALAFGLRRPGPTRTYVAVAIAGLALGLPALPPDLAPRWITVALVLASYASLTRARAAPMALVVAAALAAITPAGLGFACVVVMSAPRRARRAAVVLVALAGYALIAARESRLAPLVAAGAPVRLAIAAAVAAILWALLSAATRDTRDRALAVVLVATAAALTVGLPLSTSLVGGGLAVVPFGLALGFLVVLVGLPRVDAPAPISIAVGFAVVLALGGLRFRIGVPPRSWGQREVDLVDAARAYAAGNRPSDGEAASYRAAQAAIPAGATVGLWVDRADLLDYTRHAFIDLRTADAAACRVPTRPRPLARPNARHCRALAALPPVDYVILAPSAAIAPNDPVLALAATGRTLVGTGALTVVELP